MMFAQTEIEIFSTLLTCHLLGSPEEYLSLPNFLIIGSDVIEEPECTIFNVNKIYGWDEYTGNYSFCLFDAREKPTAGVWQNDCLAIYQDIPLGYLRLSYLAQTKQNCQQESHFTSSKLYQFFADISTDGDTWERYTYGECRCG